MSKDGVLRFSRESLRDYLASLYGEGVEICGVWVLGGKELKPSEDLKGFGYGFPYVIESKADGKVKRVVLETMHSEGFGHDHFADRAQILLWQHSAFNKLPKHARSGCWGVWQGGPMSDVVGQMH
jgi:hypothetical protein